MQNIKYSQKHILNIFDNKYNSSYIAKFEHQYNI